MNIKKLEDELQTKIKICKGYVQIAKDEKDLYQENYSKGRLDAYTNTLNMLRELEQKKQLFISKMYKKIKALENKENTNV